MPARGFTLLEVMVVLFIIGIMASAVSLTLAPNTQRLADDESVRFARVLEQAVDADEMGDTLGLVWRADGYGFRRQDASGRWQPAGEAFFADRNWPDAVRADALPGVIPLWQDGRSVVLRLTLRADARVRVLRLTPLGRVEREGT